MKHEWFLFKTKTRPEGLPCCRKCGIVKRADGGNENKPCRGYSKVVPRE